MPKLTAEEQVDLILGTIEIGKRKNVRKNLRYVMTELGATLVVVPAEEGEENEDE